MVRSFGREKNQIRDVTIENNYIKHADGSALIAFGDTKVICTAKIKQGYVPAFRKGSSLGWLSAEYSMLPCSTSDRIKRTGAGDKPNARALEIQRLIGRTLRSSVDFKALGENTIMIDCDVIQADGGTRTAAITGAFVALENALANWSKKSHKNIVLTSQVAAVSIGIKDGDILVDLDYAEDSQIDVDLNLVMNSSGKILEIQAAAENNSFSDLELMSMIHLGKASIKELFIKQMKLFISDFGNKGN